MKVKIKIEKEVDVATLVVNAKVRYWDDSIINGKYDTEDGDNVPCREGSMWCPIISFDSGLIKNWKKGVVAKIKYKICDAGSYYLKDKEGNNVMEIIDGYVPDVLCPKENGYGDYINMDIDENGQILNWKPSTNGFLSSKENSQVFDSRESQTEKLPDIKLYWSNEENDLVVEWERRHRNTALFVLDELTSKVSSNFRKEIELRGYDIKTMKFEISKKIE